jgi:hypothetical protein
MIAPEAADGKGQIGANHLRALRSDCCDKLAWEHHGFVKRIIKLPDFGQPGAKLG